MTKCYRIKSKFINLHGDCTLEVDGIFVRVKLNFKDWNDLNINKDLVSCEYIKGDFYVTKVFKNKSSLKFVLM